MSRDDYEMVEARLTRFWADHPTGRITTSLEHVGDDQVIVAAQVYRSVDEPAPSATGLAEETRADRGVNQMSYVENCETSAIGRALANLGYAKKGARPSREEMTKAARATSPAAAAMPTNSIPPAVLITAARAAGVVDINADLRKHGGRALADIRHNAEVMAQHLDRYQQLARDKATADEQEALQAAAAEEAGTGG